MWFGILGPLLVRDGDAEVVLQGGRQRVLLAALLVHAGRVVPADTLAELVWDGRPPAGAAVTLRSHVMRLRRALGPEAGGRVVARYPGYLINAGQEEVDLLRFTHLCQQGGAAVKAGAWQRASEVVGEALGLWRGTPLVDIPSGLLHTEQVSGLEELWLQAEEWRVDAGLHLGGHAELVSGLQSLAARHPLRERFHAQLMLALYRCGRQAEALSAYQHARRVMVEELGTEPGPRLRELHQQMLSADPALAVPDPAPPAADDARLASPRELPLRVRHFTGRAAELAALTGLLDQRDEQLPGTVVISAIGGTAGVGKTALAVHWAHQVAGHFPDGQLYVNLRGYDPAQPMPAADALAGFLRALGVPGQDIPPGEDERAARYRSLLAGRQMLVVLDNAGSAEAVRPLLPGTPTCTVLVTSRDALAGLVARHGAIRLDLDLLPLADAVALLQDLIGERARTDPVATAALAVACCRLPLALRVAAELAAARSADPLADLAGELADQQRRLDLLEAGGDPQTAVRAVFSWSYRHLSPAAARAFRLAGLHPGPDFDSYAVAALAGTGLGQARRTLDALARAHLIQPAGQGRYGLHDLLRAYARELAARDGPEEQQAALIRLFDHYLHTAAAAMDTLYPAERHWRPRIAAPGTPVPPVTGPDSARGWLDAERGTFVAVTVHAAEHGWPGHATRLAATLFRYLDHGGHHPEAIIIHSRARIAARQAGDAAAEATALNALGLVAFHKGRWQQATGHLEQAVALFRQTGDRTGQARALSNLGLANYYQGRNEQASGWCGQALVLHRENGDQTGEMIVLNNLGFVDLRQGRYRQASGRFRQSLALARTTDNRAGQSAALLALGEVSLRQGAYQHATGQLQQALALAREIGDRSHETSALARLGEVCLRLGRHERATERFRQALALARETSDRDDEADALNSLGDVLLGTGEPGQARVQHAAALGLAAQIGGKYQQGRAHHGLARAHQAAGEVGQARRHWQQALTLYAGLGAPEADQVRAELATAEPDGHAEPVG
jgi:DNA-binding SARP family transcriptional activator/Tfp pilus assembly protein PilF